MTTSSHDRVVDFHLFGEVDYDQCLRLQRRLAHEAETSPGCRAAVLLCEHPRLITIGRGGSREDIGRTDSELAREQLCVRWVNRGGGTILHAPGQLAIYAILALGGFGWSPSEYADRLQRGVQQGLEELMIPTKGGRDGLLGRTGLLAARGIAVQSQVASQGFFVNVNPAMAGFQFIQTAAPSSAKARRTMSCLLAERRLPVRMSRVRSAVVASLTQVLGCDRYHMHTGHPWLPAEENSFAPAS